MLQRVPDSSPGGLVPHIHRACSIIHEIFHTHQHAVAFIDFPTLFVVLLTLVDVDQNIPFEDLAEFFGVLSYSELIELTLSVSFLLISV